MRKQVNQDLKNLTNWLNGNKICQNNSKNEVVLFKLARKPMHFQRLCPLHFC